MKGLENLPPGTTPTQLATHLIRATAGIPGAEKYVGQIFPLLMNQLRTQQAFGGEQQSGAGAQQVGSPYGTQSPQGRSGGVFGNIISEPEINRESQRYAEATGTGLEGYNQMQSKLLNQNTINLQQRQNAEKKALDLGVPQEEISRFMQIGQKHANAGDLDKWAIDTSRDYKEYKNLTKKLDSFSYPGLWKGKYGRQDRLQRLDNTVKDLVDMGFEQEIRQKLQEKGMSPTEVEERIHPLSSDARKQINDLPSWNPLGGSASKIKRESQVKDFIKKNVNPDTSLLVLRDKLWNDKFYDWQDIAHYMNEVLDRKKLTTAQLSELSTVENEPPRQSLGYIFEGWGHFLDTAKGQR